MKTPTQLRKSRRFSVGDDFDSAHATAADALKMGRELVGQGQRRVPIVDNDHVARSVPAFERMIEAAVLSDRL